MKRIILVLLCLTVISMGEVNAQYGDKGKVFYGYLYFTMLEKEGDSPFSESEKQNVYFITDILRECDYENEYRETPSSDDLVKYVRNRYPNYYKRKCWDQRLCSSNEDYSDQFSSREWRPDEIYGIETYREAYNVMRRRRIDYIDEIRREDDNPIIVPIRKIDFNFFQDCN